MYILILKILRIGFFMFQSNLHFSGFVKVSYTKLPLFSGTQLMHKKH